jgi:membrane associated rhomboid family serine protease
MTQDSQLAARLERVVRITATIWAIVGFIGGTAMWEFNPVGSIAGAVFGWLCGTLMGYFLTRMPRE